MGNSKVLFITLLITAVFITVSQVYLYKRRKRHENDYPRLWKRFLEIKDSNRDEEIIQLGNKLTFNLELKPEHLEIILATANLHKQRHSGFSELKSNAHNKLKYWGHITEK